MTRVLALLCTFALAGAAQASNESDLVAAMSGLCLVSLETGVAVGPGLVRAGAAMEAKLLNGKQGKVWRVPNPKIVVVAHDSGSTCDLMGLGMDLDAFAAALNVWQSANRFGIDADANITSTEPGGAYIARQLEAGDFIQAFIQTQPDSHFVGITMSRVADSVQAREVLGLP